MHTQEIYFPNQQALCVFPDRLSDLAQAISELWLDDNYPVIVLVGGEIDKQYAGTTRRAIRTLAGIAEDMNALIICGGTDVGVMAEIGRMRWQNHYKFPLIGIAVEELAAWPNGLRNTKFLWWGKERWPLEPHYSHFILVPGSQFGDESSWIVSAATNLSKGHRSVTVLINGGEVSRKDIQLSLENGRPVIALGGTGCLADELAAQPSRHKLIPANAEQRIVNVVQEALSVNERSRPVASLVDLLLMEAFAKLQPNPDNFLMLPKYDESWHRTSMENNSD